jgi:hypothetical protein
MHDDGDTHQHSPLTVCHAESQSLASVAVLEPVHRNVKSALKVTPIGGVTQLSCETEA